MPVLLQRLPLTGMCQNRYLRIYFISSKPKSGCQKLALFSTEADLGIRVAPVYMRFLLKEHGLM